MSLFAILELARLLRSWCTARPASAAFIALALGSVVAGSAKAISPTVDTNLAFKGGVNIIANQVAAGQVLLVYTVPAGRSFMLTDLVIANQSAANPAVFQKVFTGTGGACFIISANRTADLSIPAASTLHLPFVTGIGFGTAAPVCIYNGSSVVTNWTIRGILVQ